jgi:hypothetical protein
MQHLEGSGTPVLYIGRMVLKVKYNLLLLELFWPSIISALNTFSPVYILLPDWQIHDTV